MAKINKLIVGPGLLVALAIFFWLSSGNVGLRPLDLGSFGFLYLSAAPHALVTPVPSPVARALLSEYVHLHETRMPMH